MRAFDEQTPSVKPHAEITQSRADQVALNKSGGISRPARSRDGWTIFISGLCEDAQEEDVTDTFSAYGEIMNLQMPLNRMTGFTKGYCMLEYKSREDATAAINGMDGRKVRSQIVNVSWMCQDAGSSVARSSNRATSRNDAIIFSTSSSMPLMRRSGAAELPTGPGPSDLPRVDRLALDYSILYDERVRLEQAYKADEEKSLQEAKDLTMFYAFRCYSPVSSLDVNASGLVTIASWDGTARCFDLPSWRDWGLLQSGCSAAEGSIRNARSFADTAIVDVSFSTVWSQHLGLARGSEIQLWSVGTQSPHEFQVGLKHKALVTGIDFHAAQRIVASASEDGCISVWDIKNHDSIRTLPCGTARLVGCRFLGGSRLYSFGIVGTGTDGLTNVWDIRRPAELKRILGPDAATCLDCHGGMHLLTVGFADGQIGVWDMRTWQELQRLDLRPHSTPQSSPQSIALSPTGAFLAVGGLDGEIITFDISRNCRAKPQVARHHTDAISAIVWFDRPDWGPPNNSNSQQCLACASLDGSWSCWDHQR